MASTARRAQHQYTEAQKLAILNEWNRTGSATKVAKAHGMSSTQNLYAWRKALGMGASNTTTPIRGASPPTYTGQGTNVEVGQRLHLAEQFIGSMVLDRFIQNGGTASELVRQMGALGTVQPVQAQQAQAETYSPIPESIAPVASSSATLHN